MGRVEPSLEEPRRAVRSANMRGSEQGSVGFPLQNVRHRPANRTLTPLDRLVQAADLRSDLLAVPLQGPLYLVQRTNRMEAHVAPRRFCPVLLSEALG